MQKEKRIRLLITALAMLLVVGMIGGTWAYWTQELTTRNEFQLGKYSTSIVDIFSPPTDWVPGIDVNKDVSIKNAGTVPVFAKVTLSQKWIRRENIYDWEGNAVAPLKGEAFPLTFDAPAGKEYAAQISWGSDVVLLASGKTSPASLDLGIPTVSTAEEAKGKWLLMSDTPDANGNFTAYYVGVLQAGTTTPLLVDGVTMNPAIQAATLEDHTVYDKVAKKWVTTTVKNATYDYENAHYTLAVKMDTVQATAAAVNEMFTASGTQEQSVITTLEHFGVKGTDVDFSYDDSVKTKKLFFEEKNGTMTFTPVRNSNQNWFMSHLNMLPGESYSDTLEIENRSQKTYDLYMQVVPLNQATNLDALLELIHMKVYYGDKVIYEGTAMGKEYSGSVNNLQKEILLGRYTPSQAKNIRVELTLDKNTPMDYCGLLTQIDWKFMVTEYIAPTPTPGTTTPPSVKTGDSTDLLLYVALMTISGVLLLLCIIALRKKQNEPEVETAETIDPKPKQ